MTIQRMCGTNKFVTNLQIEKDACDNVLGKDAPLQMMIPSFHVALVSVRPLRKKKKLERVDRSAKKTA